MKYVKENFADNIFDLRSSIISDIIRNYYCEKLRISINQQHESRIMHMIVFRKRSSSLSFHPAAPCVSPKSWPECQVERCRTKGTSSLGSAEQTRFVICFVHRTVKRCNFPRCLPFPSTALDALGLWVSLTFNRRFPTHIYQFFFKWRNIGCLELASVKFWVFRFLHLQSQSVADYMA